MKNKNQTDGKSASDQLILSEKSGHEKPPPIDKKKLATLEKERIKAEKKLKKGESCRA